MSPDNRLQIIIDDGLCNAIAGEEALPFDGDDEGEPCPFSGPALDNAVMDLVYDNRVAYDAHMSMLHFNSFDAAAAGMIRSKKVRALTRL